MGRRADHGYFDAEVGIEVGVIAVEAVGHADEQVHGAGWYPDVDLVGIARPADPKVLRDVAREIAHRRPGRRHIGWAGGDGLWQAVLVVGCQQHAGCCEAADHVAQHFTGDAVVPLADAAQLEPVAGDDTEGADRQGPCVGGAAVGIGAMERVGGYEWKDLLRRGGGSHEQHRQRDAAGRELGAHVCRSWGGGQMVTDTKSVC